MSKSQCLKITKIYFSAHSTHPAQVIRDTVCVIVIRGLRMRPDKRVGTGNGILRPGTQRSLPHTTNEHMWMPSQNGHPPSGRERCNPPTELGEENETFPHNNSTICLIMIWSWLSLM